MATPAFVPLKNGYDACFSRSGYNARTIPTLAKIALSIFIISDGSPFLMPSSHLPSDQMVLRQFTATPLRMRSLTALATNRQGLRNEPQGRIGVASAASRTLRQHFHGMQGHLPPFWPRNKHVGWTSSVLWSLSCSERSSPRLPTRPSSKHSSKRGEISRTTFQDL